MFKSMRRKKRYVLIDSLLNKIPLVDHFCHICLTTKDLTAHHIRERSEGGDDDPQNLMPLCRKHHAMIHRDIAPDLDVLHIYDNLIKIRALANSRESIEFRSKKLRKENREIRQKKQW